MKTYVFTPPANNDVRKAALYYESCEEGLGKDFVTETRNALRHIIQYPEAWPKVRDFARRYKIKRFPYLIFYIVVEDTVVVIAVMNTSQDPSSYQNRL